jgi:hypothetical protein
MDRFRLLLVIIILLITFKSFYKLLEKRNIVEGLSAIDKNNEMSAIETAYGPAITLSQYQVKAHIDRPAVIPISEYWQYTRNLVLQSSYNASLSSATYMNGVLREVSQPATIKVPKKNTSNNRTVQMSHDAIYKTEMGAYNAVKKIYDSNLIKYNTYIRLHDKYTEDITKYTGLLSGIKVTIDEYNAKVAAYKVNVENYDRLNDDDDHLNYRLKHYFIKASYDSAFTGTCMNTKMIEFVLGRGCRYLDFEIHSEGTDLYVSNGKVSKDDRIPLASALATIKSYSIPGKTITDPIFINLRFKYPDSITHDVVKTEIRALTNRMYTGRTIDGTTRMKEIQGKCIIISNFDKKKNDIYAVDMVDNSTALISYFNSEMMYSIPLGKDYDTKRLTVVNPDTVMAFSWFPLSIFSWGFDPPDTDPRTLVTKHGANILPFRYYKKTPGVDSYERIFENNTIISMKGLTDARFNTLEKHDDLVVG